MLFLLVILLVITWANNSLRCNKQPAFFSSIPTGIVCCQSEQVTSLDQKKGKQPFVLSSSVSFTSNSDAPNVLTRWYM